MLRKIMSGVIIAGAVFAQSVNATSVDKIHTLNMVPGMPPVNVDIEQGDSQIFKNFSFWTIKATCTLTSEAAEINVHAQVLRVGGSVNGVPYGEGQGEDFHLKNGDQIVIEAKSGAQVEVTNTGNNVVHATCTI